MRKAIHVKPKIPLLSLNAKKSNILLKDADQDTLIEIKSVTVSKEI